MIWALLEALANPEGWAITIKDGEIFLQETAVLKDKGIKIR